MHFEPFNAQRPYVLPLGALLGLFLFRVCAQLLQAIAPVAFLPPFEAWHSETLSYPVLLASQLLITWVFYLIFQGFRRGEVVPKRRRGLLLLGIGGIYFAVMLFRLVAGATFAAEHHWLGAKIPAFFHLVLASFLLVVGHFHFKYGDAQQA